MMGKTHIALGIAASLLWTQPRSVPALIAATVGGAVGGWIVDMDDIRQNQRLDRRKLRSLFIGSLPLAALLAVDAFSGNGMCQYVLQHWGPPVLGGFLCWIVLISIGLKTEHRTFTHSLAAMLLSGVCVHFFCRPAAIPFVIGYASHLAADLCNRMGIQLFFPLHWRPCLKLCAADGIVNRILFYTSSLLDLVLISAFLFRR